MDSSLICTHGYLLLVDTCFGCDSAAKKTHKSDPVHVVPTDGSPTVVRCRQCGQPASHGAHWTEAGAVVDGPYAIGVEGDENGLALDVTAFVTDLVIDLAQGAKHADLCDIAEMYESPAPHDGSSPEQLLVEELVERLATRIPVCPDRGVTLADDIRSSSLYALSVRMQRGAA